MVDQQRDGLAMPCSRHLLIHVGGLRYSCLGPILLLVKVDKQEDLVLHRGKQVVLLDKIKHFGPAKTQEVGQSFAWLMLNDVSVCDVRLA